MARSGTPDFITFDHGRAYAYEADIYEGGHRIHVIVVLAG